MGNMSYCRFQNTLNDLRDCAEHIDDGIDEDSDEYKARIKLVKICKQIANESMWSD